MNFRIQQILPDDVKVMVALLATFGEAFNEAETYKAKRPFIDYLRQLLASEHFVALAALKGSKVVGGLASYELRNFEQELSEIYI